MSLCDGRFENQHNVFTWRTIRNMKYTGPLTRIFWSHALQSSYLVIDEFMILI